MTKYGFIVNDKIDTVSFYPPRFLVPAIPAVKNEAGEIIQPAVEEHWGNLADGWIEIPDDAFAEYRREGPNWVPPTQAPAPVDQIMQVYAYAIDQWLDKVAQAKQYTNRVTIATYVTSTNEAWASESQAFINYRDQAMLKMFDWFAKFQAGEIAQPSIEEFIESMPETPWPVER